jgi:hypothetical protein
MADPDVDLVYVGTPHSHHYAVMLQAIAQGKACLRKKGKKQDLCLPFTFFNIVDV